MTYEIVFAQTRHIYGSYTYFWRLVELAGFPVCYVDEINLAGQTAAVYILSPMNSEYLYPPPHRRHLGATEQGRLEEAFRRRRRKVIWWNLERPGGETPISHREGRARFLADVAPYAPWVDAVWTCDRHFAGYNPAWRCVPVGSDPRLAEGAPARPPWYDFCHFSYVNGRRDFIYATLRHAHGLCMAPPDWGDGRVAAWRSSRCIVNVHQNPVLGGEQIRFAAAAAYAVPLLTERLADPWPLRAGTDFAEADYGELPALVADWCKPDRAEALAALGRALRDRLTGEYDFATCVRRGVAQTVAAWRQA